MTTGAIQLQRAHSFRAAPRAETIAELVSAIADNQIVLLTGARGTGKSAHSLAAAKIAITQGVASECVVASDISPRQLLARIESAHRALIVIDKPETLSSAGVAALKEAIEEQEVRAIIECVDRAYLPGNLQDLVRRMRRTAVTVTELSKEEFRKHLVENLGGPIPIQTADFFWRATGGNQELASITITEMLERGDLAPGRYAWSWNGPLEAPHAVRLHVERQYDDLTSTQSRFLTRLALVGSVPAAAARSLIDDDSLGYLEAAGFIRKHVRTDGVTVFQMRAPLVAGVLERSASPSARALALEATPAPVRDREDPLAVLSWTILAMRQGAELTSAQIVAANEAAFAVLSWNIIEEFVDLKIPANANQRQVVENLVAVEPSERLHLVMMVVQRGLASYFDGMHDRARADVNLARAVFNRDPQALAEIGSKITQLQTMVLAALGEFDELDRVYAQEIERTTAHGDHELAETYRMRRLYKDQFSRARQTPLSELVSVAEQAVGNVPGAAILVPPTTVRMVFAGQARAAHQLSMRTLALRELRITNLPRNDSTFAFTEIVVRGAYTRFVVGEVEEGLALTRTPLASVTIDSATLQLLYGFAHVAKAQWDLALNEFKGALQRFELYDQNRYLKIGLGGYIQTLAALGRHADALEAIKDFNSLPWLRAELYATDVEFRVLCAKYALGLPEFAQELGEYLHATRECEEWLYVLRAAHLAIRAHAQDLLAVSVVYVKEAAEFVDAEISEAYQADVDATLSGDTAQLVVTRAALSEFGAWTPQPQAPLELSRRQREIADLVVRGLTNREIAERLHLSVRTVESHVASILTKVDVTDRRQLAAKLALLR